MSAQKWIAAYQTKPVEALGWYAASLETSHRLVSNHLSVELRDAAVIDVGAGASVFADHMIEDGCLDITLLDLSSEALAITLSRLNGDEAITSIVGNVLDCQSLRLSARFSKPTWKPPKPLHGNCACAIWAASSLPTSLTWGDPITRKR